MCMTVWLMPTWAKWLFLHRNVRTRNKRWAQVEPEHENDSEQQSRWILKDTAERVWYGEMSRQEYEAQSGNTLTQTCCSVWGCTHTESLVFILSAQWNSGADTNQRDWSHTQTHTHHIWRGNQGTSVPRYITVPTLHKFWSFGHPHSFCALKQ